MKPLLPYILYFLLVSFVIALVTSAMGTKKPRPILAETARFFATIVVGIFLFSAVVFVLEWLFNRSLI